MDPTIELASPELCLLIDDDTMEELKVPLIAASILAQFWERTYKQDINHITHPPPPSAPPSPHTSPTHGEAPCPTFQVDPPQRVIYPTTLPPCPVATDMMQMPYGIRHSDLPIGIQAQLDEYEEWCTMPINTGRGTMYATPVQLTTIGKNMDTIRAFLGFIVHRLGKNNPNEWGLISYWQPSNIASFISFLFARKVGKGQIEKHLAVAKKVNQFLFSKARVKETAKEHVKTLEEYLITLERQSRSACPSTPKRAEDFPHATMVRAWAEDKKAHALRAVRRHDDAYGNRRPLSLDLAKMVSPKTPQLEPHPQPQP